jgi:hypothetical protein
MQRMFLRRCIPPYPKQTEKKRNHSETTPSAPPGTMEPMFNAALTHPSPAGMTLRPTEALRVNRHSGPGDQTPRKPGRIVSNTGTVSSRLSGFSLNSTGVQFIPSMSRTRKATHRTRCEAHRFLSFNRFF